MEDPQILRFLLAAASLFVKSCTVHEALLATTFTKNFEHVIVKNIQSKIFDEMTTASELLKS